MGILSFNEVYFKKLLSNVFCELNHNNHVSLFI